VILIPCEKSMGPLALSKNALRGDETLCLIKCQGHVSLGDVRHFNMHFHVWQLWSNMCLTSEGKRPSSSKELRSDTMLNHHLSQKLKLIGRVNHLINTLTLFVESNILIYNILEKNTHNSLKLLSHCQCPPLNYQ
jgi:hypothetical protein